MSIPKTMLTVFVLFCGFLLAACGAPRFALYETDRTAPATVDEIKGYFVTKDFQFETLEPAFQGERNVGLLNGGVVQLELHGEPNVAPTWVTWTMTGPGANERVKDYLDEMTALAHMVTPTWGDAEQWLHDVANTSTGQSLDEPLLENGYRISFRSSDHVVNFSLRLESAAP